MDGLSTKEEVELLRTLNQEDAGEIKRLKTELEIALSERDRKAKESAELRNQVTALQEEMGRLSKENFTNQVQAKTAARDNYNQTIIEIEEEKNLLVTQSELDTETIRTLQRSLEETMHERDRLAGQIDASNSDRDEAVIQVELLQEHSGVLRRSNQELAAKVAELEELVNIYENEDHAAFFARHSKREIKAGKLLSGASRPPPAVLSSESSAFLQQDIGAKPYTAPTGSQDVSNTRVSSKKGVSTVNEEELISLPKGKDLAFRAGDKGSSERLGGGSAATTVSATGSLQLPKQSPATHVAPKSISSVSAWGGGTKTTSTSAHYQTESSSKGSGDKFELRKKPRTIVLEGNDAHSSNAYDQQLVAKSSPKQRPPPMSPDGKVRIVDPISGKSVPGSDTEGVRPFTGSVVPGPQRSVDSPRGLHQTRDGLEGDDQDIHRRLGNSSDQQLEAMMRDVGAGIPSEDDEGPSSREGTGTGSSMGLGSKEGRLGRERLPSHTQTLVMGTAGATVTGGGSSFQTVRQIRKQQQQKKQLAEQESNLPLDFTTDTNSANRPSTCPLTIEAIYGEKGGTGEKLYLVKFKNVEAEQWTSASFIDADSDALKAWRRMKAGREKESRTGSSSP